MALYTPEYKPNGKEIAVITTDVARFASSFTARMRPSTSATSSSSPKRASTMA